MSYIYKLSDDVAPSLRQVFEERGWIEWNVKKHEPNEWNILWTTKRYFTISSSYSLTAFQKLNHFKRTSQITKKDNLSRNIKRMRANFGKIYSFYPKSYQFPLQYSEFVTMIKRKSSMKTVKHWSSSIWIAKPSNGRRGENITLFTDVSKLQYSQPMIIQKYISNPLLIGGYKFDLRIYVLITSFRPLKIYCYNDGLCRFSTKPYDINNINNIYSHLTNSSVNKKSNTFTKNKNVIGKGCKWTMNKLFKYLQHQIVDNIDNDNNTKEQIDIKTKIWNQIHDIIILTVLPIIMDVEQCPNCFELFGFDIMIDNKYNCWLLEVNGSPAIAINSDVDKMVKKPMLNHCIDCIESQFGFVAPNKKKGKSRTSSSSFQESKSDDSDDLFRNNFGGFQQIFPFNANTFEANRLLTSMRNNMISTSQKFKTIVVKEIKKKRRR